jgi:uncharacterized membrane protein YkvA (DUF1232 family)
MNLVKIALLVGACILYCACPLDLLSDFAPPFTWADDAAVIAWTVKKVRGLLAEERMTIDA